MFHGFTQGTFDFLYGLSFNNERIWFSQHKEEYETQLYRPMKELSQEVFQGLTERWPDRELQCRVTRIYKDARVYKGISCYKESLWFSILGPCDHPSQSPAMWFEVCRDSWSYGMGLYRPSPATMARHRAAILNNPQPLLRLHQKLLGQGEFTLRGDPYAKFKPGAHPQLAGWFNMKTFELIHQDRDLLPLTDGPALVERLIGGFSFLMPDFDYFYPLSDAAHQEG